MNLKILYMLLIYYSILSSLFLVGGSIFEAEGYSSNIDLNDTDIASPEIDTGGLFSTGISFGRFFTLVAFGIGLPFGTPAWFSIFFGLWQTLVSVLAVGFVISSIWDG